MVRNPRLIPLALSDNEKAVSRTGAFSFERTDCQKQNLRAYRLTNRKLHVRRAPPSPNQLAADPVFAGLFHLGPHISVTEIALT